MVTMSISDLILTILCSVSIGFAIAIILWMCGRLD